MNAERRLRMLFGVVLVIQTLTALSGIVLLERMTPAIGRILTENVRSVSAVEEMLAVMASSDTGHPADFRAALIVARGNVTEESEVPELARIEARLEDALEGDAQARADVVDALVRLGGINRAAMEEADVEAQRIGSAGRWALAFMALLGFAISFVATQRARRDILVPLAELVSVARARLSGDSHRRCSAMPGDDVEDVATVLNDLLDAETRRSLSVEPVTRPTPAVLALLDALPTPSLVVDAEGRLVAASRSALEVMDTRGEDALRRVREEGLQTQALGDTGWRLVEV